jgi:hypothetical protein
MSKTKEQLATENELIQIRIAKFNKSSEPDDKK